MKSKRQIVKDALGNERRLVTLQSGAITYRAGDDGVVEDKAPIGFKGHAAVYGVRTYIGRAPWGFYEEIQAGAFDDVLKDDVRFLVNHDPNLLLARTVAETLRLDLDTTGLVVDADMAPTQVGRDLAVLLERGDINQMSFAFEVAEDRWEDLEDDAGNFIGELRTIVKFKRLYDVSVVTYPAYAETDAALRAAGFDLLVQRLGLDDERVQALLGSTQEGREEAVAETEEVEVTGDEEVKGEVEGGEPLYLRRHRGTEMMLRA